MDEQRWQSQKYSVVVTLHDLRIGSFSRRKSLPSPDGSRGSCAACHGRHSFSSALARQPENCPEKVARRGYHLSREYAVDPLEILFVREVMRTKVAVLPAASTLGEIWHSLRVDHCQKQRLLPVVNAEGQLVGVVTRGDLNERKEQNGDAALRWPIGDLVRTSAVEAYPDEPLRVVVYRMVEKGCTRMPQQVHTHGPPQTRGQAFHCGQIQARTCPVFATTARSVEPGNTPGWVLINFEDAPADKSVRQFMTLWIGKEPFYPDDPHCWEMAIHQHVQDGGGMASAIRKIDVPEEVEDDSEEQGWASDEEVNTGSRPIGE